MLNEFQKQTLNEIIEPLLAQITALRDPFVAYKALHDTLEVVSATPNIDIFREEQVWDAVQAIREIMQHPAPQNRKKSGFPCEEGMVGFVIHEDRFHTLINVHLSSRERVVFYNGLVYEGVNLFSYSLKDKCFEGLEPEGLLSLSELNHGLSHGTLPVAAFVTRSDVVTHITAEVRKRINVLHETLILPQESLANLTPQALYLYCRGIAEISPTEVANIMMSPLGEKLDGHHQALLLADNELLAYSLYRFKCLSPLAKHMLHLQLDEDSGFDQQYLFRPDEHPISRLDLLFKKGVDKGVDDMLQQHLLLTLDDRELALLIKGNYILATALFEHDTVRPLLGAYSLLEIMLALCKTNHAFAVDFVSADEGRCWQRLGACFQRFLLIRASAITPILHPRHTKNMESEVLIDLAKLLAVHEPDNCANLLFDKTLLPRLAPCVKGILANFPAVVSHLALREYRVMTLAELRHLNQKDLVAYCHRNVQCEILLPIMLDHPLRNTLSPDWQAHFTFVEGLAEAMFNRGMGFLIHLHPRVLIEMCTVTALSAPHITLTILNSGLRNRLPASRLTLLINRQPSIAKGIFEAGPSLWQRLPSEALMAACSMNASDHPERAAAILSDPESFALLDTQDRAENLQFLLRYIANCTHLLPNLPPHLARRLPQPETPTATSLSKRSRRS